MEKNNEKITENKTVENQETGTAAESQVQNPVEEKQRICLYSEDSSNYDEDQYRECCELEEDEPVDQNSYWDWVNDCIGADWDNFMYECDKHLSDRPVLVTGYCGRWDGTYEMYPTIVKDDSKHCALVNAVFMCQVNGQSETEVWLEPDGTISINVSHHDGSNHKTVCLLTPEGYRIADDIAEYGEDSEYKPEQVTYEPFTLKHFGQE